ncbi:MAG: sugar ABC transporter permease [Eubacteriales bacterium]|nr:sugar ABC transporter permease [Eubacteriales bacterium]
MKHKKKGSISWRQKVFPYVMIAPNMVIFSIFVIIPAICGLYYSLHEWKGIGTPKFIGLENYLTAFSDTRFWESMLRTTLYALISLPLIIIIPLLLALLMVQQIPGKGFFRAAIYWPSMISYIVAGVAFKFLFSDASGIINYILLLFGGGKVEWLTNRYNAFAVVILASVWSLSGYYMVMFMSGLQSIPLSYYEAAKTDGATALQRFFRITLPLMKPTIFLVLILGLLNLFKAYGLVISLTGGGPGNSTKFVVQYIYERAFSDYNMGYACTLSVILMVILGVFTVIQYKGSNGGGMID